MGHFSSFMSPDAIQEFFSAWGLPWQCGAYHRTNTFIRPSNVLSRASARTAAELPGSYSQKALFLKNVAPEAAIYGPTELKRRKRNRSSFPRRR